MRDYIEINPLESVYEPDDEDVRVLIVRKHLEESQEIMWGVWKTYTYVEFAVVIENCAEKGNIKFSRLIKHNTTTKELKITVSYKSGCVDQFSQNITRSKREMCSETKKYKYSHTRE